MQVRLLILSCILASLAGATNHDNGRSAERMRAWPRRTAIEAPFVRIRFASRNLDPDGRARPEGNPFMK
jgi:hypothetical protein